MSEILDLMSFFVGFPRRILFFGLLFESVVIEILRILKVKLKREDSEVKLSRSVESFAEFVRLFHLFNKFRGDRFACVVGRP